MTTIVNNHETHEVDEVFQGCGLRLPAEARAALPSGAPPAKVTELVRSLVPAFVLIAFAAAVAGCGGGSEKAATEGRLVQAVEASLDSLTVTVNAWGKTEPYRRVELAFEVQGSVDELPYDEGDFASRGSVLGRLRQDYFKANLATARASFEDAERNLSRMSALSEENVISDEEREQAEIALTAAEAALASAKEDLRGSVISAPFDGVVTKRYCELGQVVVPGAPAFVFMEMDPILVTVGLSDTDVSRVREGQHAIVSLDAYPDRQFQGRVRRVAVAADEVGGSFEVEIELPNEGRLIKAGMAADVQIAIRRLARAVVLPVDTIIYEDHVPYVYLVSEGVVTKRRIDVEAQAEMTAAVQGLSVGDTVVATGNRFLRDGEPVRVTLGDPRAGAHR